MGFINVIRTLEFSDDLKEVADEFYENELSKPHAAVAFGKDNSGNWVVDTLDEYYTKDILNDQLN